MSQTVETPPPSEAVEHASGPMSTPAPGAHPAGPASADHNVLAGGTSRPAGLQLLDRIVQLVELKGGSDIHMLEGSPPRVRIRGDLLPLEAKDHPFVTKQDILDILDYGLTGDQRRQFEETNDIDFSLEFNDATGRVNVGLANHRKLHFVMRYLRSKIIPIDEVGVDAAMLKKLATSATGVIMVAGETSSGKTTTIAAMLDYINHTRYGSILTIENPVEYTFHDDKCLITRREIGRDTPDFHNALRASVRKNPDVLLIGEVRDQETANIAVTAAETGIQTFCTIHAIGAIPAITRLRNIMVGGAGARGESEFYQRVSLAIRGIISQQLVKATDGGILPIYEILNMEYAEKNYLRDADFPRLEQSLETDRNISMGKCLYKLWHANPRRITEHTIQELFRDQYRLVMNHLQDESGWKPLTGM